MRRRDLSSAWKMSGENLTHTVGRLGVVEHPNLSDSAWYMRAFGSSRAESIYYSGAMIARLTPGKVEEMPFAEESRILLKGEYAESEIVGGQRSSYRLQYKPKEQKQRPFDCDPIVHVISPDSPLIVCRVFYVNVGGSIESQFLLELNLPENLSDYILLFRPSSFVAAETAASVSAA